MIIIVIGEFKVNRPSPIMSTVDDRFLRKSRIQLNPIDTLQSPSTAAVIIAFVQTIARDTQSLGPSACSGHLDHHHPHRVLVNLRFVIIYLIPIPDDKKTRRDKKKCTGPVHLSIHPAIQPARLPNDMTMRRKMEERMDKGPTDFVIAYKCNLFRNCNNADVD